MEEKAFLILRYIIKYQITLYCRKNGDFAFINKEKIREHECLAKEELFLSLFSKVIRTASST